MSFDASSTPQSLHLQAEAYGLEVLSSLSEVSFPSALRSGISEAWTKKNLALPVSSAEGKLLLTARPDCLGVLQQAQLLVGGSLRPVLVSAELLQQAISNAYQGPTESTPTLKPSAPEAHQEELSGIDLLASDEAAPPVRSLNRYLQEAIRLQASDIHFEPRPSGLRVRFRIDGGLYEQPSPPTSQADAILSRLKVMAKMDIAERRLPQDGMAQVRLGNRVVDLRVSTLPIADGERIVLRLLDRDQAWQSLETLGMEAPVLCPFSELLARPHGLIVVSGPTGSGKTTTLYSALSTLDSSRRNILTVEDPVEYRLASIGQIQVKPKIGLTFASGLRHILRQDPDVILVGETRDSETAEIAVRAALTGHLVFTTLHTNDAPSVVARLEDMGVEPYLLASCLRGVLAQRLVRRLCPLCRRVAMEPPAGALGEALRREGASPTLYEAVGCEACLEGYRGRVGLFEYMGVTAVVADSIRRGQLDATTLREVAETEGSFEPLLRDAARKLASGLTDVRETLAAIP